MLRILVIARDAGSLQHGMVFRYFYLGREWVRLGHQVDVIAARWSHVRRVNPPPAEREAEPCAGLRYKWLPAWTYRGNGMGRVLAMLRFALQVWLRAGRFARQLRPDCVLVASPDPLAIHGALRIARKAGAICVFDARDLWPLTLVALGAASPRHPFVRLLQWSEDRACRECELVVSVQPYALRHLATRGLPADRFRYFPNGFCPDEWVSPPAPAPAELASLRARHPILVGYFGAHGTANRLDVLLDAASRIDDPRIGFVLVGQGPLKAELMRRAASRGIRNVHFMNAVPKDQMQRWLAAVDIAFAAARRSSLYAFGASFNKLYDYLASARPIVFAAQVDPDPVALSGGGVTVDPEDAGAIASAIVRLADCSAEERAKMGQRGAQWASAHHAYPVIAADYANALAEARRRRPA